MPGPESWKAIDAQVLEAASRGDARAAYLAYWRFSFRHVTLSWSVRRHAREILERSRLAGDERTAVEATLQRVCSAWLWVSALAVLTELCVVVVCLALLRHRFAVQLVVIVGVGGIGALLSYSLPFREKRAEWQLRAMPVPARATGEAEPRLMSGEDPAGAGE